MILIGAVKITQDAARRRREQAEKEHRELEQRKELSDMMFQGMARIVDRFAVCDLDNDSYLYHERHGEELYTRTRAVTSICWRWSHSAM